MMQRCFFQFLRPWAIQFGHFGDIYSGFIVQFYPKKNLKIIFFFIFKTFYLKLNFINGNTEDLNSQVC